MNPEATATVAAVVDFVCDQYPHVARRIGRADYDGVLPAVAPRSTDDFTSLLSAVGRHLAVAADPELRADLDTCGRLLASERFRVAELHQPYRGALDYAHEADVSGYLSGAQAPRADALARHLAGLPAYLARAESVLSPSISAGEQLYAGLWGPAQAAGLRGIAELVPSVGSLTGPAAAACESYARAVVSKEPASDRLGPELLAEQLRITEGIDRPVEELIKQADAEVEAVRAQLDRAAARLGETGPPAAYARMLDHLPATSVGDSLRSIIDRLRAFWAGAGVVPLDTYVPFELHGSHGGALSADVVFILSPPLEPVRRPHRVHVPEPALPAAGEPPAAAWSYLNEPALEMLAVHEIYAGHYLQMETSSATPSPIRDSLLWFPGVTEGWAHYAEELAIEQGLAADRPLIEIAQLRFALEAAVRLLVYLSVQSGRWTFAQACAEAMTINGWSAPRTTRDVIETVSNRGRAMYALGKMQIREWRTAAGPDRRDFHTRLMRCGSAPLSTVGRYLADGAASTSS